MGKQYNDRRRIIGAGQMIVAEQGVKGCFLDCILDHVLKYFVLPFLALMILTFVTQAVVSSSWPDCGFSCNAKDVVINSIYLVKPDGSSLGCTSCDPDSQTTLSASLKFDLTFSTEASRRQFYVIYDLYLNGVNQGKRSLCLKDCLSGKGNYVLGPIDTISWRCGQTVQIRNFVLTWATANDVPCGCASPECNKHPDGQCYSLSGIDVKTPLVADFSADGPQCLQSNLIHFTDKTHGGTGPYSYQWSFGDGTGSSTLQNPTYNYKAAGTFTVTLRVTDSSNPACTSMHSMNVIIYANPQASFNYPANGACSGAAAHFTDTSTPGTPNGGAIRSWRWNFGDNSPISLDQNPVHIYSSPGRYTTTLTITDEHGCAATASREISIWAHPAADFTFSNPCVGEPVSFTDASSSDPVNGGQIISRAWDFNGDEGTDSTAQKPSFTYQVTGQYRVTLKVADDHNCTGTISKTLVVADCIPPSVATSNPESPCAGYAVVILAHATDNYRVKRVVLSYDIGGTHFEQEMIPTVPPSFTAQDGWYSADIPGQPAGTNIDFAIIAYDENGQSSPVTGTASWKDCTGPEIVSAEPAVGCAGSSLNIQVNITDDGLGVDSNSVAMDCGSLASSNGDIYTFTVDGKDKGPGEKTECEITAADKADNTAEPFHFVINWVDCDAQAPQVLSVTPLNPCVGNEVTFQASILDSGSGVDSVSMSYDGGSPIAMTLDSGSIYDGVWKASSTVSITSTNTATLSITATDKSGNSKEFSFTVTGVDCDIDSPQVLSVTPLNPCVSNEVTFQASILDTGSGVDSVSLSYDGGSPVAMTLDSGSIYDGVWKASSTVSITSTTPATLSITAKDNSGNSKEFSFTVTGVDCDTGKPQVLSVTPLNPCVGTEVTFQASILDSGSGMDSVSMSYDGGSSIAMTLDSGSIYDGVWKASSTVSITSTTPATLSITATDNSGNSKEFSFTVTGVDCDTTGPVVVSVTPLNPCEGSAVKFQANVLDSGSGVDSVSMSYGQGTPIAMTLVRGNANDGLWEANTAVIISGTDTIPLTFAVKDKAENPASFEFEITGVNCDQENPVVLSLSPLNPCRGSSVKFQAHITDSGKDGVSEVSLTYNNGPVPMSLLSGTVNDGVWETAEAVSISGTDPVTIAITATDGDENTGLFEFIITPRDCEPPRITSLEPGTYSLCEDQQVGISATVEDDVGVERVVLTYTDDETHNIPMVHTEGIWRTSILSRIENEPVIYYITTYDAAGNSARYPDPGTYSITWIECDIPVVESMEILPPCAGEDAQIYLHETDIDNDTEKIAIVYDGVEHPMAFESGDPTADGWWTIVINGSDKAPNEMLEFEIGIYTADNLERFDTGPYTIVWQDCNPDISEVLPGTTNVCGDGQDIRIQAHVIAPNPIYPIDWVKLIFAFFEDPNPYEVSMSRVGDDNMGGDWIYSLPEYPEGTKVYYHVEASDVFGRITRIPEGESEYQLTWIVCPSGPVMGLKKNASSSSVAPGGTVTYTIEYFAPDDVVITEYYPSGASFISASPEPDPGTNNVWHLPASEKGIISIQVRAPDEPKINFFFEQSASGKGFVRTYKDLTTAREPQVMKNVVTMTCNNNSLQASSTVAITGQPGTELSLRESGSGDYSRKERIQYHKENRSIRQQSNLSAVHQNTKFDLLGDRSIDYKSKWTEMDRAKNYITSESVDDEYFYADRINRDSRISLVQNGTHIETDSDFVGLRHSGYTKLSAPDSKGHTKALQELSSDYSGSFRIKERLGTAYLNRSTAITTIEHYDEPHMTIYQHSELDSTDENNINYTISVLNDGNRALGPILLRDLFPTGTKYLDASTRPSEPSEADLWDSDYANWTFTYLPVGGSVTVYLRVSIYQVIDVPVNWVFASAGYDGEWLSASNSTASNFNWMSCSPGSVCTTGYQGEWKPPNWGLDLSEDICGPCVSYLPQATKESSCASCSQSTS